MRALPLISLLALGCGGDPEDGRDETDVGPTACEPADELALDDERLLRWPYYTSVTDTQATLMWGLPVGAASTLEIGSDDRFGDVHTPEAEPTVDTLVDPIALQRVTLDDLQPDTRYCFRVVADDGTDLTGPLRFRTAPPPETERVVRFVVMGDYGNSLPSALAVYSQIKVYWDDIDFWLTTGDNAYSDGESWEWQMHHFRFYRELLRRVPYFPTPGNHDYGSGSLQPYMDNLALPRQAYRDEDQERYYGFDWGPVHFSMLDSQWAIDQLTPEPGDDMIDWLKDDLAAAADRPWRISAFHHPAYMTEIGRFVKDNVAQHLRPAVEAGGTVAALAGHSHVYERFDHMRGGEKLDDGGTTYITTGGGGAGVSDLWERELDGSDAIPDLGLRDVGRSVHHFMLFEVDRCTLKAKAISWQGEEIDAWERKRC